MEVADTVVHVEAATIPAQEPQIVLILCGLIASGKSTFAQSLQEYFPNFRRCNQDDLGDRRQVEYLARSSLRQGHSVCIDRTNFNAPQRAYWINIAREFHGTEIWIIVFDTPYEVCAERLQHRTSHPTIKTPEDGLQVLSRFASDFRYPSPQEGYDRIISLKPSDHISPVWTQPDITAVLERVRESPRISQDIQWRQGGQSGYRTSPPRARGYTPPGGYNNAHGRGRGTWRGTRRGVGYNGSSPPSNAYRGQYVPRGRGQTTFRGWDVGRVSSGVSGARGDRDNMANSRGVEETNIGRTPGGEGPPEAGVTSPTDGTVATRTEESNSLLQPSQITGLPRTDVKQDFS